KPRRWPGQPPRCGGATRRPPPPRSGPACCWAWCASTWRGSFCGTGHGRSRGHSSEREKLHAKERPSLGSSGVGGTGLSSSHHRGSRRNPRSGWPKPNIRVTNRKVEPLDFAESGKGEVSLAVGGQSRGQDGRKEARFRRAERKSEIARG